MHIEIHKKLAVINGQVDNSKGVWRKNSLKNSTRNMLKRYTEYKAAIQVVGKAKKLEINISTLPSTTTSDLIYTFSYDL